MVTWGTNTTHTFAPTPAPGGPLAFGPPTSAFVSGSSLFGSTPAPTSTFGIPSASGASGLFVSSPSSAPGSASFSGSKPAPSSGLHGAPSLTSVFGTPTHGPSTFGSTTSSLIFGAPSAAPTPQQQIPAQAALQAHMEASARQEAERVRSALERLSAAYAGMALPTGGGGEETKFVAIVYNPVSPEQRQLQWLNGMVNGGSIPSPDRPSVVSEKQWVKAVVENPDPLNYVPHAMVGAHELQRRIAWQQDRARELALHSATLRNGQETIQERSEQAQQGIEGKARRHASLRKRLLDVMRRVELARCINQPMQPDEWEVFQRLAALQTEVESVRNRLISLHGRARTQSAMAARRISHSGISESSHLLPVLQDQREKLQKLTTTTQRDQRDVSLIQKRAAGKVNLPPRN